jgi:hypothetical protein
VIAAICHVLSLSAEVLQQRRESPDPVSARVVDVAGQLIECGKKMHIRRAMHGMGWGGKLASNQGIQWVLLSICF